MTTKAVNLLPPLHFFKVIISIAISSIMYSNQAHAKIDYFSVTMDNDIFVSSDSGYTNGVYFSIYDVGYLDRDVPDRDILVWPLRFLMPNETSYGAINTYSFGQSMNTPSDISQENPPPGSLPYSGILYLTNSYITFGNNQADKIATTIGVVGPNSGAEQSQKIIHRWIGSEKPQGWDTQLGNEIIFQFTRARLWRKFVSNSGHSDVIIKTEASLGTLSSGVTGGAILRYGRGLDTAYATPLFSSNRTANPVSISGGWYTYIGLQGNYIANQIIADGNTFKDSRSVEYDKATIGLSLGVAYSWTNYSLTLALEDTSINKKQFENAEDDYTRFGTLTFAIKL